MPLPVVVSVGSINVDLVLPRVLVARLGLGSRLVGQVGDDADAGLALAGPRRAGVDLEGVAVVHGRGGRARSTSRGGQDPLPDVPTLLAVIERVDRSVTR